MSYKDDYIDSIAEQFHDLENRIMADIIRRIRKEGNITSTADWQINRLAALGHSSAEIEAMIKETLNATWPEMFELYDEVIDWEYVRKADLYEQINEKFIPYEENEQLQQWMEAAKKQTQNTLLNLTATLGVATNINGQMTFLPLTEFYRKELDAAVMDIASGAFDYNSVLKRTVKTLSASGIRTIEYDSGYSNRLPVAVRRAVMTGITQMTGQISEMNAQKLGTEYYEVAWHAGARPSHREWQGKVYTKQQLIDVCGLGSVTGLHGINCYHDYYPFIPGISERNWTDEWLEEQNRQEDIPRSFRGKEYTAYEALQKQRQMETSMRAQRQKVRLMEEGKADQDDIIIEKARYQGQLAEYREFSNAMDINPQMERVYIDGLGRIAPSSQEYKFFQQKQYNNFVQKVGKENAPSFAKFTQKEYNKSSEYRELQQLAYYRKSVPNATLKEYRLNADLHSGKLVKGKVVPVEPYKAYILEDVSHKKDPSHIMKRMLERNVTDDQVQTFVDDAILCVSQFKDTRLVFYSKEGVTVLTRTTDYDGVDWIAKTTWSKHDYDENTDEIIRRAEKYV